MGTSAPIRRSGDIPIIEPCRPPVEPRRLPEPDPRRIVRPITVPVRQPEKVEV